MGVGLAVTIESLDDVCWSFLGLPGILGAHSGCRLAELVHLLRRHHEVGNAQASLGREPGTLNTSLIRCSDTSPLVLIDYRRDHGLGRLYELCTINQKKTCEPR